MTDPQLVPEKALWICITVAALCSQASRAQSPPSISIAEVNEAQAHLEWPASKELYQLEETDALTSNTLWHPVLQVPVFIAPNYRLDLQAGAETHFFRLRQITEPPPGTVPDPQTIAPALPPNTFVDLASSTAFLYSGTNAVQIGVAAGTIDPVRASVVRGKVKKRDGTPLAGVRVAILNHPEFGYTYTRRDGMYDLAVNSGFFNVDFQLLGYCPAQRQVQAPKQDFRCLRDVFLIPMDPVGTLVNFGTNSPLQVARSSRNTDQAGTRSATMLFPPGTCATLLLPDGSTQACGGLTVRASEFTVGTNGQASMPAALPPNSAYTYCAELSADEAVGAGTRSVQFNQAVWVYVDNFLNFPTGVVIPSGYYDRDRAAWVPADNGSVIAITGQANGLALVDLVGNGQPAADATLAANGFTTAELQHLATAYGAGTTVWRMPVTHFTPWDFNCGRNPPQQDKPNKPGDQPDYSDCPDCDPVGGSIDISQEIFTETIRLVGAPMALHYSSARVPAYLADAQVTFPIIGAQVPTDLINAQVYAEVAGQVTQITLPPQTNQAASITWDGRDAYGRILAVGGLGGPVRLAGLGSGPTLGTVRGASVSMFLEVTYVYPNVYGGHRRLAEGGAAAAVIDPLFAQFADFTSGLAHSGSVQGVSSYFTRTITIPDHRALGLGGWSLTPQHSYDPVGRILYLGDGRILRPTSLLNGIDVQRLSEDSPGEYRRIAVASDGATYLLNISINHVEKLGPNNTRSLVTATGTTPGAQVFTGYDLATDGKRADQVVLLGGIVDIIMGPDDSLYLVGDRTIHRIDPQGILHAVLANGDVFGKYFQDGSIARQAFRSGPAPTCAVGLDGTVYYTDYENFNGTWHYLIRKVAPDGRIYTVAGNGDVDADIAPGSLAVTNKLNIHISLNGLALASDGTLYFDQGGKGIYKISPGGVINFALTGSVLEEEGFLDNGTDDGRLALGNGFFGGSFIDTARIRITADGTIYFSTSEIAPGTLSGGAFYIWSIGTDGIVRRIAGRINGTEAAGGNPRESYLGSMHDFAVGSDGSITITDDNVEHSYREIRRIGPAQPTFTASDLAIPAADGSELYVFDQNGRHLRTLNPLTGTTNWLFTYDANNLVVAVTDANGLVTQVQRDASGWLAAIVGPYGQVTRLTVDANGFLASATDPANQTTLLGNSAGGLVLSITTPRNTTETIQYDGIGRAIQTQDAGGNQSRFARIGNGSSVSATLQSATGDVDTRRLDLLPNGDTLIQRVDADHIVESQVSARSGGGSITNSDGSFVTFTMTADPRFSQSTELPATVTTTLPGGLISTASIVRTAQLVIPGNPATLVAATNLVTLNGQTNTTTYTAANRTLVETSAEGRKQILVMDDQGRVTNIENTVSAPVRTVYDGAGRVVAVINQSSITPRRTDLFYDGVGRLSAMVDPLGRTNAYVYDAANRPVRVVTPAGTTLAVSYDAVSRATNVVTPNGAAHAFVYNAAGLLSAYIPPIVNGADDSVRYQYNADNRLTQVSFPGIPSVNLALGPDGRVNQMSGGAAGTLDFRYDANSGLMTNAALGAGETLSFGYQGPIMTNTAWAGAISGSVGIQLNQSFSVRRQTINGSFAIDFTYDGDGLLTRAGEMAVSSDPVSGFLSSTALASITNTWKFSEFAEPTNFVASFNGQPLFVSQYERDLIGRITRKIETVQGITISFEYFYDLAGRLIEVRKNGASFSAYTYDANGNRLSRTDSTGTASGTYDAQDRLIQYGDASYSYSASGDLTHRTGTNPMTATFDGPGNLIQVTAGNGDTIEYVIDAAQRRIGKKKNQTLIQAFLYQDDLKPVAELDSNNSVVSRFVYATGVNVPDYMVRGGNTYCIIRDHLGSVRLVVDANTGTMAQRLDYDEFGRVTQDTSPGFQPFGFAGGLYDPDTGWVRFGVRDYDPETGRWTSKDPARFAGRAANLYAYVSNDPVNFVDVNGTVEEPAYYIYSAGYGVHLPFLPAGFGRSYGFIIDKYGRYYTFTTTAGGRVAGLGASAAAGYLPKKKGESECAYKDRLFNFLNGKSQTIGGGSTLGYNRTYSNGDVAQEYGLTTPGGGYSESETTYQGQNTAFNPLIDLGKFGPHDLPQRNGCPNNDSYPVQILKGMKNIWDTWHPIDWSQWKY